MAKVKYNKPLIFDWACKVGVKLEVLWSRKFGVTKTMEWEFGIWNLEEVEAKILVEPLGAGNAD